MAAYTTQLTANSSAATNAICGTAPLDVTAGVAGSTVEAPRLVRRPMCNPTYTAVDCCAPTDRAVTSRTFAVTRRCCCTLGLARADTDNRPLADVLEIYG